MMMMALALAMLAIVRIMIHSMAIPVIYEF
jgi:hypothetical protein